MYYADAMANLTGEHDGAENRCVRPGDVAVDVLPALRRVFFAR